MSPTDQQVQQAVNAFRAGRREEARSMLLAIVEEDELNEKAWLYLSALVDTLEEQQICLENVLAINPDNEKARKGLEKVNQQIAAQQSPGAPGAPEDSASTVAPFAAPPDDFSPPLFASGDDSWSNGDASSAQAFGTPPMVAGDVAGDQPGQQEDQDWLSLEPTLPFEAPPSDDDSYRPPTSVEWGKEDGPAVYGSGRNVDLPSPQDYDAWVEGLNLSDTEPATGGDIPTGPTGADALPFSGAGDAVQFGDTSFVVDAGPFALDEPPVLGGQTPIAPDPSAGLTWADEPAEAPATSAHDAEPGSFDVWGAGGDAPGAVNSFERSLRDSITFDDISTDTPEFAGDAPELGGGVLSGELSDWEAESGSEPQSWSSDSLEGLATEAARPVAEPDKSRYYQYIPPEIEAASGGLRQTLLFLLGIVLMLALNAVSLSMLLS